MTAVLLIGFILQFVLWLPCPLCLLPRIGFVMVAFGFMLNVVYGPQSRHYGVIPDWCLVRCCYIAKADSPLCLFPELLVAVFYLWDALLHLGFCVLFTATIFYCRCYFDTDQ